MNDTMSKKEALIFLSLIVVIVVVVLGSMYIVNVVM
jgi:flagellar basal body-associated protein FliL